MKGSIMKPTLETMLAFARKVVLDNDAPLSLREEALNLLIAHASDNITLTGSFPTISLTRDAFNEIEYIIGRGLKIQAIKLLRSLTGIGLKEAKDAIESTNFRDRTAPPGFAFPLYNNIPGQVGYIPGQAGYGITPEPY